MINSATIYLILRGTDLIMSVVSKALTSIVHSSFDCTLSLIWFKICTKAIEILFIVTVVCLSLGTTANNAGIMNCW